MTKHDEYFYEKRYKRKDGRTYVKRYSRSFPLGREVEQGQEDRKSNVAEASVSRARSKVRLLAFSNPDLLGFLTLTFRGVPTEEEAQECFKQFRDRVSKAGYKNFKFLGVKELQKRGSIHYHLLVNYCPGLTASPNNPGKLICPEWIYGFSDYDVLKGDDGFQVELYLLKYMTKLKTKLFKSYYVRSRNLDEIKPQYSPYREPIHPLAENIFSTMCGNKNMEFFLVQEYNYDIHTNKRRNANANQLKP